MKARDRFALALAGFLGPSLLRAFYLGLRFSVAGEEWSNANQRAGQPVIYVAWHGRLLPLAILYRGQGIVLLVSSHRDGEYLARLGRGLGYESIRGSSTRGGYRALRDMVRAVRSGRSLGITPDGPQGPRERFKPGALQIAQLTGAPVIPVAAGTPQAWWIEGWDRFLIPKPYARIRVAFGQPRYVARDASARDLETAARDLEEALQALKSQVDE